MFFVLYANIFLQNTRMHAYVPESFVGDKDEDINVGNIYIISNFTVKEYKPYERFRVIHSDKQIIFTTYTKVKEAGNNETLIQENEFDFYDFGDLDELGKQNVYLTGT